MQSKVLASDAEIIGVGGEAGGGKTDAAFGLSLRHPNSILFRYEFTQMENHIIARGDEIFGAKLKGGLKRRWKHRGGTLQLGALKYEGSYNRYQGGSWPLMIFDEAPNMRKSEVLSVMGWNRWPKANHRCQALLLFNPPSTPEGEWVIAFFAPWLDKNHPRPAREGEIRWFITIEGQSIEVPDGNPVEHKGRPIRPRSRTFFRSYLNENPDLRDTYPSVLASLPYPLNQQLLDGDFEVGLQSDAWQLFPTDAIKAAQERWKSMSKPVTTLDALGVDVAWGGNDRTVIAARWDDWFAPLIKKSGIETPKGGDVAALVMEHHQDGAMVNIDALAAGASPTDSLQAAGVPVRGVNFGEGSDYTDESGKYRMGNFRAEVHWRFKEALEQKRGRQPICLPPDDDLTLDLRSPRFYVQSGRVYVESKDDLRKRLGRSPDCSDAVILADLRGGDAAILGTGKRRTLLG